MRNSEQLFVWFGGGAFVLSLGMTAYAFAVTWGATRVDAGETWRPLTFNVATFSIFALHHSIFARDGVKRRLEQIVPARLIRSLYVWAASLLLILVVVLWQPLGGQLYRVDDSLTPVCWLIQLAGVWLIAEAVRAIDPLELAGIREATTQPMLQTRGPYRLVRHPLYLGWLLLVFGVARMTGDRFVFAVVSTIYLLAAVPWEERSLLRLFGDKYAAYQSQVRWRIVPFVF